MHELDRSLRDIEHRLDQARDHVRRRRAPADDGALIQAIEDGTASPADIAQLARILAPAVRSQLIHCAIWRSDFEIDGGELPFSPTAPMQVVVEMCSVPAEDDLPGDLEHSLALMLKYAPDFWKRIKSPWMSRTMFLSWVEATVLLVAAGSADCMAIRRTIDGLYDEGPGSEVPFVPADERALRLAAPLRKSTDVYTYELVSEIGWPLP